MRREETMTDDSTAIPTREGEAEVCDMAIVGAGAAGLAAAIFAGEEAARLEADREAGRRIVLLDAGETIGAKILVSGGGRCNVTNETVRPEDYNGNQPFIRNVLSAFGAEQTVKWFAGMGLDFVCEEKGKLFPARGGAKAVRGVLTQRAAALGIPVRTGCRVREILAGQGAEAVTNCGGGAGMAGGEPVPPAREGDGAGGFVIRHDRGSVRARRVILATGGQSLPRSGSDGSGWVLAGRLGHSITATHQALVPLLLAREMYHASLSGLSQVVDLSTYVEGRRTDRRRGSLLWTHFGISGPVVLDASRHWIAARMAGQPVELRCRFFPGWDREHLEEWLIARIRSAPRRSVVRILSERLPERFVRAHLDAQGIAGTQLLGDLKREVRRELAASLTDFVLPVTGERGWEYAEVTAGGIPLHEVDYRTMASRKADGLFLAGEILDCDGRIGGFNFQWAWATGHLAGRAAARGVR
jgi:predicted flavoprotein YhiN